MCLKMCVIDYNARCKKIIIWCNMNVMLQSTLHTRSHFTLIMKAIIFLPFILNWAEGIFLFILKAFFPQAPTNSRPWLSWADSPHNRLSGAVCVVEKLVPVWQESISLAYRLPDEGGVLGSEQPGFPAGCVYVSMCTEKRLVSSRLVPSHQKLSAGMFKETTNISWGRGRQVQHERLPADKQQAIQTLLLLLE